MPPNGEANVVRGSPSVSIPFQLRQEFGKRIQNIQGSMHKRNGEVAMQCRTQAMQIHNAMDGGRARPERTKYNAERKQCKYRMQWTETGPD